MNPRQGKFHRVRLLLLDLPLQWKLLLPLALLMLLVGGATTFFLVDEVARLSGRAVQLDVERATVAAQSTFVERQLLISEAARRGAHLQGMSDAVATSDVEGVLALIRGAGLLPTEELDSVVSVVAILNSQGSALAQIERLVDQGIPSVVSSSGYAWAKETVVSSVLSDPSGRKSTGILSDPRPLLVFVSPIRTQGGSGEAIGAMLVGTDLSRLAIDAASVAGAGVTVFNKDGTVLTSGGRALQRNPNGSACSAEEGSGKVDGQPVRTAFVPLQGIESGECVVLITVSTSALTSTGQTGQKLAITLTLAALLVIGLGSLIARLLLSQIGHLVEASREFGKGDLAARAPVLGKDELGELTTRFNTMAEELGRSYEVLERKVDERTNQLAQVNEELQRTYRLQSEFFAKMTHELRSPLFAIRGNAEMMLSKDIPLGRTERVRMLGTIRDTGDYLVELVNEILDFKRLEAGKLDLELKETRLTALVPMITPGAVAMAKRASVDFEVQMPDDLPTVRVDSKQTRKVIDNLLSNAFKFTPEGGRVVLAAEVKGDSIDITVEDSGVGIPPQVGVSIFDPFYQVRGLQPVRGEPSSGLGLALAKQLVEAQGGKITYRSEPGKGSIFTISLPSMKPKSRSFK